jgi:hypothetical protein
MSSAILTWHLEEISACTPAVNEISSFGIFVLPSLPARSTMMAINPQCLC